MNILGISCGHNANVCLLQDGVVVAHYEKERHTRIKNDGGKVDDLIKLLLEDHGMAITSIDLIASSVPVWPERGVTGELLDGAVYETVFRTSRHSIRVLDATLPAVMVPHHLGHAAYAYHLSGFDEADVIALDAGGNFTASVIGHGVGRTLEIDHDLTPGNIGSMWSMASRDIFGDLLAAGKLMGLAPYGTPRLLEPLLATYETEIDGFSLPTGSWSDDESLPGFSPASGSDQWRSPQAQDLAASIQELTNRTVLKLAAEVRRRTGRSRLCLSGGVALNGITNQLVASESGYADLYVPPAVDDRGLSIGFALQAYCETTGERCHPTDPRYLGRRYRRAEVRRVAEDLRGALNVSYVGEADISEAIADELLSGMVVAVWTGRAESGPRALGHRSILADPRRAEIRDRLNLEIKERESFRPFAPAVLEEYATTICEMEGTSPYMLRVVPLRAAARDVLPAVCHVDGSTRPQTLSSSDDEAVVLCGVLEHMAARVGVPAVLNTSFNVRGEPIVDSPEDAVRAFRSSSIDILALGEWMVRR